MGPARRSAALAFVVLAFVMLAACTVVAGAASETDPCRLLTKGELQRGFGTKLDLLASDRTVCFWGSQPGRPGASIGVGTSALPAAAVEAGKRSESRAPGAVTIPGVGDLTVYQTAPGQGGSTTVSLLVFDGRVVGRVTGSVAGEPPTAAAMKRVARSLADRM